MENKNHVFKNSNHLSRRKFLKNSAISTIGLSLIDKLAAGFAKGLVSSEASPKSKVVLVRHSKVANSSGKIQQKLLQQMLDKAITTLTGKSTPADAWKTFVSPEDVVGLKINTLGLKEIKRTELVTHFSAMNSAILSGLKQAGVAEERVIVWDRRDDELVNAGLSIYTEQNALRIFGTTNRDSKTGIGFSREQYAVGTQKSRVSRILTDMCTVFINVPLMKTHRNAGMTCSLKNHYGSIDNPGDFHPNSCTNPGIAEVNAIPVIRKKQRLIVCDALLGVYEGGPNWRRQYIWPYGGILLGTDPVALDYTAMKILDEQRRAMGLPPLEPRVEYLKLAEQFGLGTCQPEKIDFIKIELV